MDEVDGMSGGDRGGVADLIETIKRSKVPVIAICNDKYHQKLKSLRNHCLELEFRWAPKRSPPCLGPSQRDLDTPCHDFIRSDYVGLSFTYRCRGCTVIGHS